MYDISLVAKLDEPTVARMAELQEFLLKGKHGRPLDHALFRECLDTGFIVAAWHTSCAAYPVCEEDVRREIAGMCYVFIHQTLSRRVMIYEELVVDPAHRGTGLADKIDQFLIRLARDHGCDCIEGTMPIGNEAVRRVHLRNGFSIREQHPFRLILNHFGG